MDQITALLRDKGWPDPEAAKRCGLTQPRFHDLLHGRISRFCLDDLVNLATVLGQNVHVALDAA